MLKLEYSNDNIMTRKEYLKSKNKQNFFLSKFKYILLVIVVVLLGVYVFKQLNVYNNVTKIANKVVEESSLAKTMTMYYVSEPYTKGGESTVMLYKSNDESRTTIVGSEGLSNILVSENMLYGIKDNTLYSIDLTTTTKQQVVDKKVQDYSIADNNMYLKTSDGIYKYNIESKKEDKIIEGKSDALYVDDNNIYLIAQGKTNKSIIRYNLNGGSKKQLSDKYIVSSMNVVEDNIYFVNSKDSKIYATTKSGEKIYKVSDSKITANTDILSYKDKLFFVNKSDGNTLYMIDRKTGKEERVVKKNIDSIQIDKNIIYYSLSNSIEIHKFNIDTGKTAKVTSARISEYICKN